MDCSVLPLLLIGLFSFQLDRMNLASALTGGFAADINISQATINLGNQLMFMGIVIFEIPCNMALQRVSYLILFIHPPGEKRSNDCRSVLENGSQLRSLSSASSLLCKYSSEIEGHSLPHDYF